MIHLKRFMQTSKASLFGSAFTNLKKRDDDLTFPQELDLAPFLTPAEKPPRSPSHRSRDIRVKAPSARPTLLEPAPSARYRLYAVVVHIGTLAGGHYINYVLSDRYSDPKKPQPQPTVSEEGESIAEKSASLPPRRWFHCSDDEVRPCSVDEVLKSKAYML